VTRTLVGTLLAALLLTAPAAAAFRASVAPIPPSYRLVSWRPGCPVKVSDLRLVTLSYRGFDGLTHTGRLVMHRDATDAIVKAMHQLYDARFPIRRMVPVDAFGGHAYRAIAADDTSGFNCRKIIVDNAAEWSEEAYGRAVDIDPIENPAVGADGRTAFRASEPYLDRSRRLPGMIRDGDAVTKAFASVGWGWGGHFLGTLDYKHFSSSGR
jgi:hypothetical protein